MAPQNKTDKMIGTYIESQSKDTYKEILSKDENLALALYLSELANGLFGWYPFTPDSRILQVGSWFGAFTAMLGQRCKSVTVLEQDDYRFCMAEKRLKDLENIHVVHQSAPAYCEVCTESFDYVIFAVDENIDIFPNPDAYARIIESVENVLSGQGKLLFALPNRLGVKYLCGAPDPGTKVPFDGITENNSALYRFDRDGLLKFMEDLGFPYIKLYYPMSDHHYTQVIYTDDCRPGGDVLERLHIYTDHKTERLLYECELADRLAKNGVLHCFANSFLIEAGQTPCALIIYSALSAERDRDKAFATNIYADNTVEKIPLYPDGQTGLWRLLDNTRELACRGIPVLPMKEEGGRIRMERVRYPSFSNYLRSIARKDPVLFIDCLDKLYDYILQSSAPVLPEKNCMLHLSPDADWGVILANAYIEMIPVNSFWTGSDILFYDQEFTMENCPAGFVMFRALRDIYAFSPETEQFIPLHEMKARYGLADLWDYFAQEEEAFQTRLRRRNLFNGFYPWVKHLPDTVQENRRRLDSSGDIKEERDYFNAVSNLDGRRIVLFGAGRMAEHYLNRYGRQYPPVYMVDNDPAKWGSQRDGIEIRDPGSIQKLMPGTYRVVITMGNYETVVEQLEGMGIHGDSYRIFTREMDALVGGRLTDTVSDGKYNIGYVTGVFDLFHIGHLNLLRNCKSRCHYLIAGVLTDELTKQDKNKTPFISFEERIEIVRQCNYVDRVVPVDFHNTNKVDAWKELRYGCLFSGSDHEGEPYWIWLQRQLRSLGSELEFFPYTQSTSSTMLQKAIREGKR